MRAQPARMAEARLGESLEHQSEALGFCSVDEAKPLKVGNNLIEMAIWEVESDNAVKEESNEGGRRQGDRSEAIGRRCVLVSDVHMVSSKLPRALAAASRLLLTSRTERQAYFSLATTPTRDNL